MALTTTLLTSGAIGNEITEVAGFTTASINPGADCYLVFTMSAAGASLTLHDTGHTVVSSGSGPTWTKQSFDNTDSDFHYGGVVWTASIGGSSPGSFTVTVDWPGSAGARYAYSIHRVTGTLHATQPAAVATTGSIDSLATTVTLPSSPDTDDVTIALSAADVSSGGAAVFTTPGTWTTTASGTAAIQQWWNTGYRTGSTSPSVAWSNTNGSQSGTSGQAAITVRESASLIYPYLLAAGTFQAEASTTTLGPVPIPATAAADDIMILGVMCNSSSTFSTPTDWTVLGTAVGSANQSTAWFWKRHDGTETDPSTTTSATMSGTVGGYGRIWVFRNCKTTGDPFEDVTMNGTPTNSTTPASAAIDTTDTARLAVSFTMIDGNVTWLSGNPPSGWDICGSRVSSTLGGDATFDAISQPVAAAGSVSAVNLGTISSQYWRTLTLALIPPAAPASPQSWTGNSAIVDTVATSGAFVPGTQTWVGNSAVVDAVAVSGSFTGTSPQSWTGNAAVVNAVATSGAFVGISPQTWTGTAAVVDAVATAGAFTGTTVLASLRVDAANEGYTVSAAGISQTACTMSAWVRWPSHKNDYFFFLGFDNASSYFNLGTTAANALYFSSNNGQIEPGTPHVLATNTWYHIAITWSSTGTDTLYVAAETDLDHTTYTDVVTQAPQTAWQLNIGTNGWDEWSNVEICAVKIWTATLSDAEIDTERDYYLPIRTTSLWAAYPFDDGPETTDHSGNGRTLALRSGAMTTGGAGPSILLDATGPQTWTGNAAVVYVTPTSGSFVSTGPQTWGGAAAQVYVAATSGSFAAGLAWPTSRSGRKILDQFGEPWMIRGQAVWSLGTVSQADQFQVIDALAAHGHNCIMVTVTETFYSLNADRSENFYGESPFTGNFFGSPLNSAFWNRWLATVDYGATKGISFMMVIAYAGFGGDGSKGFMNARTTTECQQYGNDLATLHLARPNVMYMIGGDLNFTSSSSEGVRYNAMMLGIKAADPTALIFGHSASDVTAWTQFGTGYSVAIDANHVYTYDGGGIPDAATAWTQGGNTLPLYFIEGAYWHGEDVPDQLFRSQIWMGCSWGLGCFDGHVQLWSMGSDASDGIDWELNLTSPEMAFTGVAYDFFADPAVDWGQTLPDFGATFLTTGSGAAGPPTSRAAVARGPSYGIVYFPNSRAIVCNLTAFSGSTVNARWFDPTDGSYSTIGTFSTSTTSQAFTHPGNNTNDAGDSDWVLVLEGPVAHNITPDDVDHLQDVEDGSAGGTLAVTPADVDHLQDVETATLTQTHVINPEATGPTASIHLQDVETTTATPAGVVSITPADVVHFVFSEAAAPTQSHQITPADVISIQTVETSSAHDPTTTKYNITVTVGAPMLVPSEGTPVEEGPGAPVFRIRTVGAPMLASRSADALLLHGNPGQPVF